MKNTLAVIQKIEAVDLEVKNGKVKQTVRNELKNDLLEALTLDLGEHIEGVRQVSGGVAVATENKDKHLLTFVINPVFKKLDFDIDYEADSYQELLENKAKLAQLKKEARASK